MIKKLALSTAVVVAVLLLALVLWEMREAIQLFVLALAISAGINPTIKWLTRRGIQRHWATIGVFGTTLWACTLSLFALGFQITAEMEIVVRDLPRWYDRFHGTLLLQSEWLQTIGFTPPDSGAIVDALLTEFETIPALLMDIVVQFLLVAVLALSVASIGFYWLLDQQRIERFWLSLFPLQSRTSVRLVWSLVYHEVGIFVRGEIVIVALTTILLYCVYVILGLPGSTLLAIVGGLSQVVPVLGLPIALAPALFVAMAQSSATAALTMGVVFVVLVLVKSVIAPQILRNRVTVNPVLVIVCIMALGELVGVWFILLGPPLAAAIQTTAQVLRSRQLMTTSELHNDMTEVLQARLDAIEARILSEQPDALELRNLLARTRELVAEAAEVVPVTQQAEAMPRPMVQATPVES